MRNTILSIVGKAWIVLLAALLLLIYIGLDRKRRPVQAPSASIAGVEAGPHGVGEPSLGRRTPIVDRHESAQAPAPVIPPSPPQAPAPVSPPAPAAAPASVAPSPPETKPEAQTAPQAALPATAQPPSPAKPSPATPSPLSAAPAPPKPLPVAPAPAVAPAKPTVQAKLEKRRHVVRFGPNQKAPSPAEEKKLHAFLQPHEGKTEGLRIIGRADGSGAKPQNAELAKTRAESVARIVERAVPHLLIKDAPPAEVLGVVDPKRPAAQERAQSRRVEVEITIPAPEVPSNKAPTPARNVPKQKTSPGKRGAGLSSPVHVNAAAV